MPRYHFHILDGRPHADDLGLELADLETAKIQALRIAGSVLNEDKPVAIWAGKSWAMQVTDSPWPKSGRVFLSMILSGSQEAAK